MPIKTVVWYFVLSLCSLFVCLSIPSAASSISTADTTISFSSGDSTASSIDDLFDAHSDSASSILYTLESISEVDSSAYANAKALSIEDALGMAAKNNIELRKKRSIMQQRFGDKLLAVSRWIPQFIITQNISSEQEMMHNDSMVSHDFLDSLDDKFTFDVRQRVAEFGKVLDGEWGRLRDERRALYAYEDQFAATAKNVRYNYFSLALTRDQIRRQQITLRRALEKMKKAEERLRNGMIKKKDVLSVRLSVLNERELLYSLRLKERDFLEELKNQLGLAPSSERFRLTSATTPFNVDDETCIKVSMKNSTRITDAEAEATIMQEKLKQYIWSYMPAFSLTGKVIGNSTESGISVDAVDPRSGPSTSSRQYKVDLFSTTSVSRDDDFKTSNPDLTYTVEMSLKYPVFDGLTRLGDKIKVKQDYLQARDNAISVTRDVERNARRAVYLYRLGKEQLAIVTERIMIERERFEMNEALNELGRLSDDDLDNSRDNYFRSQDAFLNKQFEMLKLEEELRLQLKLFE